MRSLSNTRKKLSSILSLIEQIESGDFPYSHSKDALTQIRIHLETRLQNLTNLNEHQDPEVINIACKEALSTVLRLFPLIGFIVRSTDIRNSFELHGPFLRLTQAALQSDAKLVISSEWEYSPLTFVMPDEIKDTVFIGLPASESGNARAIPLSGHELGHNLWSKEGKAEYYSSKILAEFPQYIREHKWDDFSEAFPDVTQENLEDLLGAQNWRIGAQWSLYQCEELFCDFVGIYIFRTAFLDAFDYLLAPGTAGVRQQDYPGMQDRVRAQILAAQHYGVAVPENYLEAFEEDDESLDNRFKVLLEVSDAVTQLFIQELINDVSNLLEMRDVLNYDQDKVDSLKYCFATIAPANDPGSLANILNAGWQFFREGMQPWKSKFPDQANDDESWDELLNELIFKSIEVLEVNQRQKVIP